MTWRDWTVSYLSVLVHPPQADMDSCFLGCEWWEVSMCVGSLMEHCLVELGKWSGRGGVTRIWVWTSPCFNIYSWVLVLPSRNGVRKLLLLRLIQEANESTCVITFCSYDIVPCIQYVLTRRNKYVFPFSFTWRCGVWIVGLEGKFLWLRSNQGNGITRESLWVAHFLCIHQVPSTSCTIKLQQSKPALSISRNFLGGKNLPKVTEPLKKAPAR